MRHTWMGLLLFLIVSAVPAQRAIAQAGGPAEPGMRGQWTAVDGEMYGVPISEASLPFIRLTFDEDEARWTLPGYPQRFRYMTYGGESPDSMDFRLETQGENTWLIPVRSRLRGDTLDVAFPLAEPFDPSENEAPPRPTGFGLDGAESFLRLSLVRQRGDPPPAPALAEKERRAAAAVEAEAIERMTRALVASEMEGRGSGQPGGERAALAIAGWFREAGLEPLGEDGFLQRVPLVIGRVAPSSSLTIGDTTFRVGDDFAIASLPMRTRPQMEAEVTGEVVLFGPSLGPGPADASPPDLDVKGKIVALTAATGPGGNRGPDIIRTYEALHRNGAEAVIVLLPGPLPEAFLHSPMVSGIAALDADLYGSRPAPPVVLLGFAGFKALFGDGSTVREFMGELGADGHVMRPTGKHVTISYRIEEATPAPTYNIAGVIRGADPELRDEAVLYTAHYDAFGTHEGEVFPGAADNALGVAEMIEIADAIRESGVRPRRSIVFLAVGAEERGMLGTLHWIRQPTWPLERVVANINMDGGDAEAWGTLHGVVDLLRHSTSLGETAARLSAARGLPLLPNDGPAGGYSDFYDFLRAGIPAIQLYGIGGDPALAQMRAARFGAQRVHQPGDVIDEGWDWDGPREMAQLYLLLGLRVADTDERPAFQEPSPSAGEDDAIIEEGQVFMEGYAEDLLGGEPDSIAARYSRRGAYLVRPGARSIEPCEEIVRKYREGGPAPDAFEWQNLWPVPPSSSKGTTTGSNSGARTTPCATWEAAIG